MACLGRRAHPARWVRLGRRACLGRWVRPCSRAWPCCRVCPDCRAYPGRRAHSGCWACLDHRARRSCRDCRAGPGHSTYSGCRACPVRWVCPKDSNIFFMWKMKVHGLALAHRSFVGFLALWASLLGTFFQCELFWP